MLTVITIFWRLCTFRAHSSQVPTFSWLVSFVALADIITSVVMSLLLTGTDKPMPILTAVVVQQACLAGLLWLALYFRNFVNRFPAVITAVFGCDLLLTALLGGIIPLARGISEQAVSSVIFVFFFWTMAINGQILHQALQIRFMPATAIAFGIWFLCTIVSQSVLEPPA